jgi:hypothetical protein
MTRWTTPADLFDVGDVPCVEKLAADDLEGRKAKKPSVSDCDAGEPPRSPAT